MHELLCIVHDIRTVHAARLHPFIVHTVVDVNHRTSVRLTAEVVQLCAENTSDVLTGSHMRGVVSACARHRHAVSSAANTGSGVIWCVKYILEFLLDHMSRAGWRHLAGQNPLAYIDGRLEPSFVVGDILVFLRKSLELTGQWDPAGRIVSGDGVEVAANFAEPFV